MRDMPSERELADEFRRLVRTNAVNAALLSRLKEIGRHRCFLVAGCLFQTYWNRLSDRPSDQGIRDYDVFYFDDRDLSWEVEDRIVRRVGEATRDLGIEVDVKNQARVHLWYEQRFGHPCPPLRSCEDGIDRYLVACTCVGIDVHSGALYAPNGLRDLRDGVLRANPKNGGPRSLFEAKAEDYRMRWPWLRIERE
jgi:uncharacterized protein